MKWIDLSLLIEQVGFDYRCHRLLSFYPLLRKIVMKVYQMNVNEIAFLTIIETNQIFCLLSRKNTLNSYYMNVLLLGDVTLEYISPCFPIPKTYLCVSLFQRASHHPRGMLSHILSARCLLLNSTGAPLKQSKILLSMV
jgi:hypothetical protein